MVTFLIILSVILLYIVIGLFVTIYIDLKVNKNEDNQNNDSPHYAIYYGLGPFIWPILLLTYLNYKNK